MKKIIDNPILFDMLFILTPIVLVVELFTNLTLDALNRFNTELLNFPSQANVK